MRCCDPLDPAASNGRLGAVDLDEHCGEFGERVVRGGAHDVATSDSTRCSRSAAMR
jgi:hypothetical protein